MKFTAKFERSDITIRLAALDKRELAPHEGFNRENDGSWMISIRDENDEVVGRVTVDYKGTAKKKDAWNSADPEGQAIAFALVEQINHA